MGCMGSAPAEQTKPETDEVVIIEFDRESQQDNRNKAKELLKALYEFLVALVEDDFKDDIKEFTGTWKGDTGTNKGCDAKYNNFEYYEVTKFAEVASKKNFPTNSKGTYELLFALSYTSVFYGKAGPSKDKQIHSESGFLFFTWDYTRCNGTGGIGVMKGIVSERGVNILAGGSIGDISGTTFSIDVEADIDSRKYGIIQSPYVYDTTRSIYYHWKATIDLTAGTIEYFQDLHYLRINEGIPGSYPKVEHTHHNMLTRDNPGQTE